MTFRRAPRKVPNKSCSPAKKRAHMSPLWLELNRKKMKNKELEHTTIIQEDVFRFQIPARRKKNTVVVEPVFEY